LNYQVCGKLKGQYKITKANFQHNHPITRESYQFHHRNRQLPQDLKQPVAEMLAAGAKVAKVALLMSQKCGKIILPKDLYNQTTRTKIPEYQMQSMIKPNMSEKAKYNAAFRIAQELVNNMKRMKQNDFENHLKKLMQHSDLISKRVDYVILPIDSENDKNDKSFVHGDNLTVESRQFGDNNDESNNSLSSQTSQFSIESTTSTQSSKSSFNLNEKRIVNGI
jgi:hypothetical protein